MKILELIKNKNKTKIKIGDKDYYFDFANLEELRSAEDLIIEQKDAKQIYDFAIKYRKCNLEKMENAIIETKNAQRILDFGLMINSSNKQKILDSLIQICLDSFQDTKNLKENKDAECLINFIQYANPNDIAKIEDVIVKVGKTKDIYNFAHKIKGANIDKLSRALLRAKGDIYYVVKFAKDIEGAYLPSLEQRIINDSRAIVEKIAEERKNKINSENEIDKR